MGKLYNNLQKQLKTPYKEEAEQCIEIYNKLKKLTGGVFSSDWESLTKHIEDVGVYPNAILIYKPSVIGELFLKGVRCEEKVKIDKETILLK